MSLVPTAQGFLDKVFKLVTNAQPKLGAALDVYGHGEFLGVAARLGGKALYLTPNRLEFWGYVSAGLSVGTKMPNWFPLNAFHNHGITVIGAVIAAVELPFIFDVTVEKRLLIHVNLASLGGNITPFLEGEAVGLSFLVDPKQPMQPTVLLTAGAGVRLPFLPDLGKLIVQLSPKLEASGDMIGIVMAKIDLS